MHQQSDAIRLVRRAARLLLWVALPLGTLGLLRAFPPLPLAGPGPAASAAWPWMAAAAAGTSAAAMLAWLVRTARAAHPTLGPLLVVAATGSLTAGWIAAVLAEPALVAAESAPPPAAAIALLAAGIPLALAAVAGDRRIGGRQSLVAIAVIILIWIEAAPAAGLFGAEALGGLVGAIAAVAAGLLAFAAVITARGTLALRVPLSTGALAPGWVVGVAAAAASLALARAGTADALVPAVTCAVATAASVIGALAPGEPGGVDASTSAGPPEAPAVPPATADAQPGPPMAQQETAGVSPHETAAETNRLARELRDAIAQLLAARETIRLQRAELERLATTDVATGVLSRGAILERMRVEVAEARRYPHPVVALLLAVDGLAGLNRALGLESGDAVLREVALRLRVRIREADALGRTSGDTFLALLPHTDDRGAAIFAEALRSRVVGEPVETPAGPVVVTASIGISLLRPGTELTVSELLGRAEEALQSARTGGGNRIAYDRLHGLARLEPPRPGASEETASGPA